MAFIEVSTAQAQAQLEEKLKGLYPPDAHRAISRSINKALSQANTQANREIRSIFNISLKDLNDRSNKAVKNSNPENLTGTINASPSPLSLSKFDPVWVRSAQRILNRGKGFKLTSAAKDTVKRGKGFRVTTKAQGGVTLEILQGKKVSLPSAFILFKKGGTPVMARGEYQGASGFIFGKSRLPINKMNTKSVFFSMMNDKVEKRMNDKIMAVLPDILDHEITKGIHY